MPESTYHQIHFAWAEPTLLGRVGPGPASSSLPETEQPVLRSWRDRLVPALTADYRSALPDTDPADYPETLWAHAYPDGQAALVYRWPGDVRSAHAWAIVGPGYGLTLPRILALHENPNTRPAQRRPPAAGWGAMGMLPTPEPWERTATPGAVRTRDRRAVETVVDGEPLLVGAIAAALARPDLPVHIALAPERADLWQAVQLRFLWGMHRALHDVLTPPRAIPAAGWSWSFSTYDPVLGTADGQHLAFGPPTGRTGSPFLNPPPSDHRGTAEALVAVLREEGGDALAAHLAERGVPDAPTFADRRELLKDWLDPRPAPGRTDAATDPGRRAWSGAVPGSEMAVGEEGAPGTPGSPGSGLAGSSGFAAAPGGWGRGAGSSARSGAGPSKAEVSTGAHGAHGVAAASEASAGSAPTTSERYAAPTADRPAPLGAEEAGESPPGGGTSDGGSAAGSRSGPWARWTGRRRGARGTAPGESADGAVDVPEAETLPDAAPSESGRVPRTVLGSGPGTDPGRGSDTTGTALIGGGSADASDPGSTLPDLPEAEAPGEEETGPQQPLEPRPPLGPVAPGRSAPGARLGQGSLRGFAEEIARAADAERDDRRAHAASFSSSPSASDRDREPGADDASSTPRGTNESLWPAKDPRPEPVREVPGTEGSSDERDDADGPADTADAADDAWARRRPRIAPAREESATADTLWPAPEGRTEPGDGTPSRPRIFDAPEPHAPPVPEEALDFPGGSYYGGDEIVTDDPTPVAGRPRVFGRTLRRAADRDARAAQRRAAARAAEEAEEAETHEASVASPPGEPGQARGAGETPRPEAISASGATLGSRATPTTDETGQKNEAGQRQEFREPRDNREALGAREILEPQEPREPREPWASREFYERWDSPGARERRPIREPWEFLEPRESHEPWESRESREPREPWESRKSRELRGPRDPREPHEIPATTETRAPETWTIAASPSDRADTPAGHLADTPAPPVSDPLPSQPADAGETRLPADAPPLRVGPAADEDDEEDGDEREQAVDYATETEPEPDDPFSEGPSDDSWPTQYADLPLARLERWHSRRGPEGARVDVVDARAALRAERAELQRVREERDHYHGEVQDLRRDVARLDRPWLDSDEEGGDAGRARGPRRWPSRVLVLILLAAFLATGLEAGARFGLSTLELLGLAGEAVASLSWWPF